MNKLTEPKIPQADEIYDLTIRASFTDKEVRERIEIISEIIQAVKDKNSTLLKTNKCMNLLNRCFVMQDIKLLSYHLIHSIQDT